ncbi:lipid-A-disaccharide synthase [Rhodanobacter sp. AS-Z3]|uniref:lipid-A-disaccharide synthase n=1 Tax=Rhodanobacter sp. AS-Z3 TaxID=3031330 RepID=UPI002478D197|nr:lipid-A-disaccharide synthase [Rhodanobacter sp. AS-Z3]WEN16452.1 lipid-A-disaccharide synthase [Rhodanobacter sp. AS-Z3]
MQDIDVSKHTPLIAMLAGEESGDQLGADLIVALRKRYPQARFVGIGGARMQREGFESWYDIGELSLFGFSEVVRHLPRLLRLRKTLVARLLKAKPDVVVGIDAPDFNLGVEQRLKQAGLLTVHYVSPSVWAWREKRAEKIGRSAQRVLCLFPMEPAIYAKHGIDARFVGHPLADRFALVSDRVGARDTLQLSQQAPVLAVLPGSRLSEVGRLGQPFIDAAVRVAAAIPGLQVIIPAANPQVRDRLAALLASLPQQGSKPVLMDGQAHEAMLAADVVLLASGTATLEAMLAKRPMVVGYRVAPMSYRIARALKMLKTDVYSLPNILARASGIDIGGGMLVPELMQENCTADKLAAATLALFQNSERRGTIVAAFEHLHHVLQGGFHDHAGDRAAAAIAELIDQAQDGA